MPSTSLHRSVQQRCSAHLHSRTVPRLTPSNPNTFTTSAASSLPHPIQPFSTSAFHSHTVLSTSHSVRWSRHHHSAHSATHHVRGLSSTVNRLHRATLRHTHSTSLPSSSTSLLSSCLSSSFSTSSTTSLHPPFNSSPADASIPACDTPSLNPATAPINPTTSTTLGKIRPPPIRHLLIYKKVTTLEEIRRGVKQSIDFPYLREDAKVLAADREHQHTIAVVRESIALSGVEWREVEVIDVEDVEWADCIICVGGDGTFLKASRHIQETENLPIVGVNSAPSSSFGFFSAADHHSFPGLLKRILNGSALIYPLWRARLCVNAAPVGHPILNEILFCNPIPSATTRYLLTNHSITQLQQSSGIWISTAAGSTGAILGAGGQLMHLSDWRFQYRVRELFSLPITHPRKLEATDFPHIHYNSSSVSSSSPLLTHGYLGNDFHFISRMMSGCLYLDGSIIAIPVQFNDKVSVRRTERPLQWVCPTKDGEGKEQIDHWEVVVGMRRAKMPGSEGSDDDHGTG